MKKIIYLFFFILIHTQVSFSQNGYFKQTSALLSKAILKNANDPKYQYFSVPKVIE